MYNVIEMKQKILDAVKVANNEVRGEFESVFSNIYKENKVPNDLPKELKISINKLETPKDLDKIHATEGFYIIFTDLNVGDNNCALKHLDSIFAIYRGECGKVKRRIQSHLFNKHYKSDYEKRKSVYLEKPENSGKDFHEQYWPACLKIGNGESGLNIHEDYHENNWYVLVHNMRESSQEVRVQAELAFDNVFGKPIASREKT
ncbi:hypothetical protein [Vibrio sp. ED002]|uniref:hypothetical protein n=1 Tax=Vibrio sp. ED002 TaxID=2785123 RepID=UPI00200D65B5|nr:hypothetical protein [Vibrio sp. ED002]UQA51006.1 hypothetical protein ITG12_01340 [Vibrio sp. ED002]